MGAIKLFGDTIKRSIGPFWALLTADRSVLTFDVDLNVIKLNSTDVIFVKLENVFFVILMKLKKVDAIPEIYAVFEGSKQIYNKIKRAFLFANLRNEFNQFWSLTSLG